MKMSTGLSDPTALLNRELTSIEAFALRYFSVEQTILVETLLSACHDIDVRDDVQNADYYAAELSTGTFCGLYAELMQQLKSITSQLKGVPPGTAQYDALNNDRKLLETAPEKKRIVYEWYAVPYWIADYFIRHGEVVLIWQGLCWWGNTEYGLNYRNIVVIQLFGEIETQANINFFS